MLDKSLPYIGVLMVKSDPAVFPRRALPENYTFRFYSTGLEQDWSRLQYESGQTDSLEKADEIFRQEFLVRPDDLVRQCLFVENPQGQIVATASLWTSSTFGRELPRLHWVVVTPHEQGRGLAKALLTRLLERYAELGWQDEIYLTSQTWSYKAINIYAQYGFRPYFGVKPANWICDDFAAENDRAWNLIREKIRTRDPESPLVI